MTIEVKTKDLKQILLESGYKEWSEGEGRHTPSYIARELLELKAGRSCNYGDIILVPTEGGLADAGRFFEVLEKSGKRPSIGRTAVLEKIFGRNLRSLVLYGKEQMIGAVRTLNNHKLTPYLILPVRKQRISGGHLEYSLYYPME